MSYRIKFMKDKSINKNPGQKSAIVAAIVVICLMFVFGLGHRILAGRLIATWDMPEINPDALAKFPMKIGLWEGREAPLDEVIIEATDTEAHISRNYLRNNGLEAVWLYVAFGQRARDLMPHRPEVCYTGAGWTLTHRRLVELPLDDGAKLPCRIIQFTRGTLIQKKIVILDYYIVDGRLCGDISLLRSKIWRGSGAVNYIAQIQIFASVLPNQDSESIEEILSAFAVESAPYLSQLLESFNIIEPIEKENSYKGIAEETGSD